MAVQECVKIKEKWKQNESEERKKGERRSESEGQFTGCSRLGSERVHAPFFQSNKIIGAQHGGGDEDDEIYYYRYSWTGRIGNVGHIM